MTFSVPNPPSVTACIYYLSRFEYIYRQLQLDKMSDVSMSQTALHEQGQETCFLCQQIGGDNQYINTIPRYVSDNIDKAHIDQMCQVISAEFKAQMNVDLTPSNVKTHLLNHVTDKKVVVTQMIHELRDLMQVARQNSVSINDETQQTVIDHKTCALYLDVIKQIVFLYKSS
jgi:hypothetical protein